MAFEIMSNRNFCQMVHIYFIGSVCEDIILHVDRYPNEDEKIKTEKISRQPGGNSGNALQVLSQCYTHDQNSGPMSLYFMGAFGGSKEDPLAQHLESMKVCLDYSSFREQWPGEPRSFIISTPHSRTVVNHNPIDPMTASEFSDCLESLHESDNWFHFEGRHCEHVMDMIKLLQPYSNRVKISIECEKFNRPGLAELIPFADLLFFSKSFAVGTKATNGLDFLNHLRGYKKEALLAVSWGDQGSFGKDASLAFHIPCAKVESVDTIGAGDTWIASTLYQLAYKRQNLRESLTQATALATRKCGIQGYKLF